MQISAKSCCASAGRCSNGHLHRSTQQETDGWYDDGRAEICYAGLQNHAGRPMDGDGTQLRGKGIVPGNDDNQTAIPKNGWQTILSLRPILPSGGRADATAGQRHRRGVRAEAVPRF